MLKSESIEYIKAIAERYGAEKILLFGSCIVVSEEEANDIDLVVYGLDALSHWDMRAEMAWPTELGGKTVDLVRAENNEPVMVFASKGVSIYERDSE